MNKKELSVATATLLKKKDIRKKVPALKTVIHVSDDDGNTKDFIIKKDQSGIFFNATDVDNIITACFNVIVNSIKNGERVNIHGFGDFNIKNRAKRQVRHPESGEIIDIKEHTVTKFTPGKDLQVAAKLYDLKSEGDNQI